MEFLFKELTKKVLQFDAVLTISLIEAVSRSQMKIYSLFVFISKSYLLNFETR